MKKLRTRAAFQEFLDEEFAWRLKEIADVYGAKYRRRGILPE